MFASSRIDKGGSKFRPVIKPRAPRASTSSTPAPPDAHPTAPGIQDTLNEGEAGIMTEDDKEDDETIPPGPSARSGSLASTAMPPPSALPLRATQSPATGGAVQLAPTPPVNLISASSEPTSLPSGDQITEATIAENSTTASAVPHISHSIQPSKGISIVPARGISITPTRGTSIVPSRGATVVPTRGTSVVPSRGIIATAPTPTTHDSQSQPSTAQSQIPTRPIATAPVAPVLKPISKPSSGSIVPSRGISIFPSRGPPPSAADTLPSPSTRTTANIAQPPAIGVLSQGPPRFIPESVPHLPQVNNASIPHQTSAENSSVIASEAGPSKPRQQSGKRTASQLEKKASSRGAKKPRLDQVETEVETPARRRSTRARKVTVQVEDHSDDNEGGGRGALFYSDEEDEPYENDEETGSVTSNTKGKRVAGPGAPTANKRRAKRIASAAELQQDETPLDAQNPGPRKSRKGKRKAVTDLAEGQHPDDGVEGEEEVENPFPTVEVEYDEEGNPLPINPEVITMGQLCVDIGFGRESARTEESVEKSVEWKNSQRMLRRKARQRQKAKFAPPGMYDLEDGVDRGEQGDMGGSADTENVPGEDPSNDTAAASIDAETGNPSETAAVSSTHETEDFSNLRHNRFAAQVRLDENGDIILDDLSLTVDRREAARSEHTGRPVEEWEIVEEADKDRFINNLTYSKKISGSRWTKEETELFYYYHSMWGTDFEMISHMMVGRTRKEIKNKYNSESKRDPRRLDMAFANKVPIDLEEYSKTTGLDLSGPAPEFGTSQHKTGESGDETAAGEETQEEISIPEMDDGEKDDADADLDADGEKDDSEYHTDSNMGGIRLSTSPDPFENDGAILMRSGPLRDAGASTIRAISAPANNTTRPNIMPISAPLSSSNKGRGASDISLPSSGMAQLGNSSSSRPPAKGKDQGHAKKGKGKKKRHVELADDEQVIGAVG